MYDKAYPHTISKSAGLVGVPRTISKLVFKDKNGNPSHADEIHMRVDNLSVIGITGLCHQRPRSYHTLDSYAVDEYFTVGTDYYIFLEESLGNNKHFLPGDTLRTSNSTDAGNDQDYVVESSVYGYNVDSFEVAAGPTYYIYLDATDGDRNGDFTAGDKIVVVGSDSVLNDKAFTIEAATFPATKTRIEVTEVVIAQTSSSATARGGGNLRTRITVASAPNSDESASPATGINCVTDEDYPLRVNETWRKIPFICAEIQMIPAALADGSRWFIEAYSNRDISGTTIT